MRFVSSQAVPLSATCVLRVRFLTACAGAIVVACVSTAGCATKGGYGISQAALDQQAQQRDQAAKDKPDSAAVYLTLIEEMQRKGMYFASLAHLDEYERLYGISPKSMLMRGDALRATDQLAASLVAYRALTTTPFAAQGYRGIGLISGAQGDFESASDALDKAASANPTDSQTLSDLGYARMRAGDVAGARVPLMKAAELDDKNLKVMGNLALYLLADGQTKNANGLMDAQNMSHDVREAVRKDAIAVATAARAREKRANGVSKQGGGAALADGGSARAATAHSTAQGAAQGASSAAASSHGSDAPSTGFPAAIAQPASGAVAGVQPLAVQSVVAVAPIDQIFPSQQWRQGPTLAPFPVMQGARHSRAN